QIIAACFAKLMQWIYVLASQDLAQLSKRLVGLEVGFDDQPNHRIPSVNDRRSRKHPHAAYHGIEVHEIGDFGLVGRQRFAIEPRCFLDERLIELLSTALVLNALLHAGLSILGYPRCVREVNPPITDPDKAAMAEK